MASSCKHKAKQSLRFISEVSEMLPTNIRQANDNPFRNAKNHALVHASTHRFEFFAYILQSYLVLHIFVGNLG